MVGGHGLTLTLTLIPSTVLLLRLLRGLEVALLLLLAVAVWLLFLGLLDGRHTRLSLLIRSGRIDRLGEGGGSSRVGSVCGTS